MYNCMASTENRVSSCTLPKISVIACQVPKIRVFACPVPQIGVISSTEITSSSASICDLSHFTECQADEEATHLVGEVENIYLFLAVKVYIYNRVKSGPISS